MVDLSQFSDDELMALAGQAKTMQATRTLSAMSDEELARIAGYKPPPAPPPGVTIHTGKGDVFYDGKDYKNATPAETEARFNREAGGIAGDTADAVLHGVPYAGPFVTRANAALRTYLPDSALSPGNGLDYATNLQKEQARASTFDQDYSKTSMAAKTGGAVLGAVAAYPVTKVAGPVGAVARTLMGAGGSGALSTAVRGTIAGLGQGVANGVGRSNDATDVNEVVPNALKDGGIGAALGFTLPLLAAGGVKAYDWARNLNKDTLSSVAPEARQWLLDKLGDPAKLAAYRRSMDELGPNAVFADVSPEMHGVAGGAASRPGSREMIVKALNARDAGKNARINDAVVSQFGPDAVPSQVKAGIDAAKKALSPEYEAAFAKAKEAVDTQAIAQRLNDLAGAKRGPAQEAAQQVRDMLAFKGTNILDGSPRTLHQVRMAIDGMMDEAVNGDVRRVLTEARKAIDDELAAKVPGIKPIDSRFADLSRQWDAFKLGQEAFDTGRSNALRPSELAAKQTELVQPAGSAAGPPTRGGLEKLSQGARSEVERIVGTNANDVAALNRLLKGEGDWNRDKLRLLFGQDKADKVLKVLDAEQVFQNTRNSIVGGSPTEPRRQFNMLLDSIAGKKVDVPTSDTAVGLVKEGVKKLAAALNKGKGEEYATKAASDLGRLAVSGGGDMDSLIAALMTRAARQQTGNSIKDASAQVSPGVARLLEAITRGDDRSQNGRPRR